MLRAVLPVAACAMMVTVVACSGRDPVAEGANNVTGLPAVNADTPSPDGSPPPKAASATSTSATTSPATIRAVPGKDAQGDADSFSGTFAFTGEGQSWSKFEALKLQGRDLVRTETNPTASFTYAKCT